jgi:hypothetical protein
MRPRGAGGRPGVSSATRKAGGRGAGTKIVTADAIPLPIPGAASLYHGATLAEIPFVGHSAAESPLRREFRALRCGWAEGGADP